jgi:predicted dinucleotide-binding enzyme
MKIGILGSGEVAQTLGAGFLKHGHTVTLGTRQPHKLEAWSHANPTGRIGSFIEAAAYGELVVIAVKGAAALEILGLADAAELAGKTVIDTCNPTSDAPPIDGVLSSFTGPNESLMEQMQQHFPDAHFVKALNSIGADLMVDPVFSRGKPTMFICGNDEGAKATVTTLLGDFGWDVADMGRATAARAIEPLAVLWCIPGFLADRWTHAFALFV